MSASNPLAKYMDDMLESDMISKTGKELSPNVEKQYNIFYKSTQQFRKYLAGPGTTLDVATWLTFKLWIQYMEFQISRMLFDWQNTENKDLFKFRPASKYQVDLSKTHKEESAFGPIMFENKKKYIRWMLKTCIAFFI